LVVFECTLTEEWHDLLEEFCSEVCEATDMASLIFRERKKDSEYRRKVGMIGHSFRTPLQALQFELESLGKAPSVSKSPELKEGVRSGMARIRDAREDLYLLLEDAVEKEETFNLIEILNYVLKSMETIARKKACPISKRGLWPESIPVRGIKNQVQRALTCLVDNAIKYSYSDSAGIYQARVEVIADDNYARIIINNFGIGIPTHKLNALKEYGLRGDVVDGQRSRLGTGLGLPFAMDTFEKFGGWIDVISLPANQATEEEIKTYHRYITTVEAALPILRRN
jgi:signal transduction histidine kinase